MLSERAVEELPLRDGAVELRLRPSEICTLLISR
jgi:hypothetical protein